MAMLPFTFVFYGDAFTSVGLSANGVLGATGSATVGLQRGPGGPFEEVSFARAGFGARGMGYRWTPEPEGSAADEGQVLRTRHKWART